MSNLVMHGITVSEETINWLKSLSERETTEHDDLFGMTPDDAYELGLRDGYTDAAALILARLERLHG